MGTVVTFLVCTRAVALFTFTMVIFGNDRVSISNTLSSSVQSCNERGWFFFGGDGLFVFTLYFCFLIYRKFISHTACIENVEIN